MAQIHAYIHACMHTWIHNILLKYMHTCHVHPYIEACIHGCMHCLNTCRHGWNACIQTYIAKIRAYSIEMHVRACTISQGSPSCQVMTDFEVLRVSFFKRGSDYFRFYRFRVPWGKCGNPENGKHDLVFLRNPGRDEARFWRTLSVCKATPGAHYCQLASIHMICLDCNLACMK